VAEVVAVPLRAVSDYLRKDLTGVTTLGREIDDAYLDVAASAVVDPRCCARSGLRSSTTNLHGTGAVHTVPLLIHAGCSVIEVTEQLEFDPRFPTVKSPNPENAEALSLAVSHGRRKEAATW
jgi:phosphoglucomutase